MAGRGPAPKDAARRARTNADPRGLRVIMSAPVEQPPLPDEMPSGYPWPEQTRTWWEMWRNDPLSTEFRATDWADLLDTAVIHGMFWRGETKLAGELRLRVAKHGATQEDRARLRITFAAADEADEKRGKGCQSSFDRRGPLTAS